MWEEREAKSEKEVACQFVFFFFDCGSIFFVSVELFISVKRSIYFYILLLFFGKIKLKKNYEEKYIELLYYY